MGASVSLRLSSSTQNGIEPDALGVLLEVMSERNLHGEKKFAMNFAVYMQQNRWRAAPPLLTLLSTDGGTRSGIWTGTQEPANTTQVESN